VEYDAEGRIDQDLSCFQCDYNVRMMLADGQCPECGASVHESARIAWWWQNDPAMRRLARCPIWIGVAVISLVSPLSLPVGELFGGPFSEAAAAKFFIAALTIGSAAGLYGFWQLTTRHLGGDIGRGRVRRVARWAMTAGLIGLLAVWPLTVVCFVVATRSWMIDLPSLVFGWLLVCSYVCLGVGAWATLTYKTTRFVVASGCEKIDCCRLVRSWAKEETWRPRRTWSGRFMRRPNGCR
jgi:hypothetical protein